MSYYMQKARAGRNSALAALESRTTNIFVEFDGDARHVRPTILAAGNGSDEASALHVI